MKQKEVLLVKERMLAEMSKWFCKSHCRYSDGDSHCRCCPMKQPECWVNNLAKECYVDRETLVEAAAQSADCEFGKDNRNYTKKRVFESGFMCGAGWRDRELWNDNTQFPKDGNEPCLVCMKSGETEILMPHYKEEENAWGFCDEAEHFYYMYQVHSWAYLDNVLSLEFNEYKDE